MIPKLDILRRIIDVGLVVVVRAESADQALRVAEAVQAGGAAASLPTLVMVTRCAAP